MTQLSSNFVHQERAALGAIRVRVNLNGSDFALPDESSIYVLLYCLQQHSLDPMFEDYGNFMVPCHEAVDVGFDPDSLEQIYVDRGPIYEDAPNAIRFHGNFLDIDHPFSVDTDDRDIIEELQRAIRRNQQTDDYQNARAAWMLNAG